MNRLKGKVAVITGGGGCIGRTLVQIFVREGAKVGFSDIDEKSGLTTQELVSKETSGGESFFTKVDVSKEIEVKNWIDSVASKWGKIDILVNNAAVFIFGTVEEASSEDWDRILGVNVKGYAFCAKHSAPHLRKNGGGSIVNIGSISSFIAQEKFVPYNSAKGAVLQMTRCMAMDMGVDNIRVNAVCPGTIDTDATSKHAAKLGITKQELVDTVIKDHFVKRLGTTEDVAYATVFLAGDESTFITGTTLVVDGGVLAQ